MQITMMLVRMFLCLHCFTTKIAILSIVTEVKQWYICGKWQTVLRLPLA